MKAVFARGLALALATSLAACTSMGPQPAEVTRFHLNQPIARGEIAVEPADPREDGLEFRSYADAVSRQLARLGWTVVPAGQSEQLAAVSFEQTSRYQGGGRSPVSVGVGGSTGGWHSGVGGGISFGLGGKRSGTVTASMLSVRLKRRSDGSVFWEGRAQTVGSSPAETSPDAAADRLAAAMFQDFPGESGRTISVK